MKERAAWLALQQLLDSALPIGGFAHSFGLETLVQEGAVRNGSELEQFARAMLRQSWAPADAMVIKAVYRDVPEGHWARLWHVERLVHAQRLGMESRTGLEKLGKRLLRLAAAVHPGLALAELEQAAQAGDCSVSHPLVYGWVCLRLGISLEQAAQGYLYSCVLTCVNCALRLLPMGQTEGQAILARLLPAVVEAWEEQCEQEPEEAWTNMPHAELAMMRHETLYSRLFMS